MKKNFAITLFAALNVLRLPAQTETFDIATLIAPPGWQRLDSNGVLAFYDSRTANGLTSFGQIVLFPSWASKNAPAKNFEQEWDYRVVKTTGAKTKPSVKTEKTPDGWTLVTGSANISAKGIDYSCVLVTVSGFEKVMSVMINIAGGDYASTIEKFFNDLNLDSKAIVTASQQGKMSNTNQNTMTGTITMNDYDFVAPEGWQVQKTNDGIRIQNMKSGCLLLILAPQASTRTLEEESATAFDMMYKGWQPQNTGSKEYDMSKGFLMGGLEYCMIEARMSMTGADGRYNLEDGAAWVVRAGNQNVIIAVRHNSSLLGHDDCWKKYETCTRFFNSFTVKNVTKPKDNGIAHSQRIVGVWKIVANGPVAGDYIFAANGRYQFGGAIGTSSTSTDFRYEYLHVTSYAWQGDGSYSINADHLTMNSRAGNKAEQVRYRFAQINHGGTGWKDRIYLLKTSDVDGKEYEVCYEKE